MSPLSSAEAISSELRADRLSVAGLITPPIIFASQLGFTQEQSTQMVAVSLIASGILSAIQMTRIPIPFTKVSSLLRF